jgi:F-type H+-transporting ATPase subunit gamma
MATLRDVRRRIAGVKTTQKITRAMKMVAAAKLRRAQSGVVSARPYARKIRELLQHLAANVESGPENLFAARPVSRVGLVVVTSDRGMCGAFNSNLIKAVERHIESEYARDPGPAKVTLFCVGKKGADYFGRRQYDLSGRYIGVYNTLVFLQAKKIVKDVLDSYLRGDIDRVDILYNEFKSIAQQRIVIEKFLPIPPETINEGEVKPSVPTDYIYEPSGAAILHALVPKHLDFQLWRILLESNASEQGARMAAMENATENAEELISTLQLQYNKARQASITRELLEIVSGAEALSMAG